ncbi:hypothetical protein BGZ82_003737, partial [Podila clonocystis]
MVAQEDNIQQTSREVNNGVGNLLGMYAKATQFDPRSSKKQEGAISSRTNSLRIKSDWMAHLPSYPTGLTTSSSQILNHHDNSALEPLDKQTLQEIHGVYHRDGSNDTAFNNPSVRRNTHTTPRRNYKSAKNLSDYAKQEDEIERTHVRTYRKYLKRTIQEIDQEYLDEDRYLPVKKPWRAQMSISEDDHLPRVYPSAKGKFTVMTITHHGFNQNNFHADDAKTEVIQAECHKLRLELINKSDPCSVFSHEIWNMVLDSFPMSHIVNLSLISKTWLASSRGYLGFKVAAMNGQLGEPKVKYKNWMSLTCSKAEFVCEYCFGYFAGTKVASHIPIMIQLNGDPLETWALCQNCRNRHYRLHPEEPRAPCSPLDLQTYNGNAVIHKTIAMRKYALKPADLDGIQYFKKTFGHVATVFLERDIQVQACQIHGGWIGLEAMKAKVKAYRLQLVKKKKIRYRQYMSMTKETAKSNHKPALEDKRPRSADTKQPTETMVSYKEGDSKVSDENNKDKPLKEEKVKEMKGKNNNVEY